MDRQDLLNNFAGYKATSDKLKAHAQEVAAGAGRQYLYLAETHTKSRGQSKEKSARRIMAEENVTAGLAYMLAAVEPYSSFDIYRRQGQQTPGGGTPEEEGSAFLFLFRAPADLGLCHV